MRKVYLVMSEYYEVRVAFSSREKAEEYLKNFIVPKMYVEEWVVWDDLPFTKEV